VKRTVLGVLFIGAALAPASAARAQFVQLTRCQSAYPCSTAFGLQYKPDPLIAGPFASVSHTAVSGRIDLQRPVQLPAIDLSKELEHQDFAREAARIFVLRHATPKAKPASPPTTSDSTEPTKN
jgi:hypothetical protein